MPVRRTRTGVTLVLVWLLAGTRPGAGQEIFDLVEVADGVYATVVRDGISPSAFANSLIVVRDDHVLLVDSRHTPGQGSKLVETVREISDLPIRYLVNTHWHTDHVLGNQSVRAAFPDVRVVAQASVPADLAGAGRARVDQEIARYAGAIETRRGWLERGARDDGTELTDDEEEALRETLEGAEAYLADIRAVELVAPDLLVEEELVLDDALPVVHLLAVGPAHTRGDIVVWIPDRSVLATGDLIEAGYPYFGDGYPAGWLAALDRLAALDAQLLVPAHGPVPTDRELFETEHRFIRDLVATAAESAEAGRRFGPPELLRRLSGYRDFFTGADPEQAGAYATFLLQAFGRAYAEATGELTP